MPLTQVYTLNLTGAEVAAVTAALEYTTGEAAALGDPAAAPELFRDTHNKIVDQVNLQR